MHPVYRQIIVCIIAFISIVSTCNRCQKQAAARRELGQWNAATEKQMYDTFYQGASGLGSDEDERAQYAACCLHQMKALFPEGLGSVGSEVSDSIKVAVMKIGADCAKNLQRNHPPVSVWNADLVKQMKLRFYSYQEAKLMPGSMKDDYVDCLAFEVMAKFPNGPQKDNDKAFIAGILAARKHCSKLVLNKYQKQLDRKLKAQVKKDTLAQ
nr:hypothetical protein [uncultured Mucilaginibacter sp.]